MELREMLGGLKEAEACYETDQSLVSGVLPSLPLAHVNNLL